MNVHKRYVWLLSASLLVLVALGLSVGLPQQAVAQGASTPTHVPPPPRTLPPGIRLTPVPQNQSTPTPQPSENLSTPTPMPTPVNLPVSGSPASSMDPRPGLMMLMGCIALFAAGLVLARRSRTR